MPRRPQIRFRKRVTRRPSYDVFVEAASGRRRRVGSVEKRWIKHIEMIGWEATLPNGQHRAVHTHRWKAAAALLWNGRDYSKIISPVR